MKQVSKIVACCLLLMQLEIGLPAFVTADDNGPSVSPADSNNSSPVDAKFRTWTSADGGFTVEAILIADKQSSVVLKTKEGREITVPLEKMSAADQQFVVKLRQQPAVQEKPPAPPTAKVGPKPVYWQVRQMSQGGKFLLDMDGVWVLFAGMPLPPTETVTQKLTIDGPDPFTGHGATGTAKYRITIDSTYADGVATIKVELGQQKQVLEIRDAGKKLVINDKQEFDLSAGKVKLVVERSGKVKKL